MIHLLAYVLALFSVLQTALTTRQIPLHDSTSVIFLQQTLALYAIGTDTKDFSIWSDVFSPNIVANYSAPFPILTGLPNLTTAISTGLLPVTTQHALSSFSVVELDNCTAKTVSQKYSHSVARVGREDQGLIMDIDSVCHRYTFREGDLRGADSHYFWELCR